MDSSRRAVEAYWRSRMVDGVTSDEDKVAPVYKLEEICDLLRNSHASIVKEVSVYILKRLDHKSPIVKQKVLRLIKYSVGKSGVEFQREMQRQSAVMRELYRYQGQPDPLKGDALNKAVRDSAHEAVTALFANANNESTLVAPTEGTQKRIEGFGNTNYTMPTEEKKSFLSEVVGIGLSTIAAANSMRKSDNGSYKSPNLRRSLTTEVSGRDRYEVEDYKSENYSSAILSKNVPSGTWSQDVRTVVINASANEDNASNHTGIKSREERLLDTIVTSGGVRLQPTRDAIQVFLTEALKLDAVSLSRALEMKLQSPLWQVRMKACCILESILRKKDDEHFSIIASYFSENSDSLVRCSDLPQVSLREKATKVLHLLDGDQQSGTRNQADPSKAKSMPAPPVQMPDLIDTGEPDDDGSEALAQLHVDQNTGDLTSSGSLVDDLLDDGQISGLINSETRREDPFADVSFHATEEKQNEDDPFADVSFHATEEKQLEDIFSGLTVDDKKQQHEHKISKEPGLLDYFSTSNSVHLTQEAETSKGNVDDLMAGFTFNATVQENKQSSAFNGGLGAPMQYNIPPNMMFDPAFATQQMNYGAMGAFIAQQQQLLYQNLGNLNTGYGQQQLLYQNLGNLSTGYGHAAGNALDGGHSSSPLPDIFHPSNNLVQSPASVLTGSKKEDTKAFDFISDHISTARGSKRV